MTNGHCGIAGWRRAWVFAAVLLVACDRQGAPDIAIGDGWARETAPGQAAAAVYLTVANRGDGDDRLINARSSVARAAVLHSSTSAGGVARMRPIEGGLEIPARARVELKPEATHIMLTELNEPLSAGHNIDLVLGFARSGRRPIAVRVVPAAADEPADHRTGH